MNVIDTYKKNGAYIAKGLLGKGNTIKALNSINKMLKNQLYYLSVPACENVEANLISLYRSDIDRYKKIAGSLWRNMEIFNLLHHANIAGFLEENFGWSNILVPSGQVLHIQSESLKIPGGYYGLPSHQDWPSVQGSVDGLVVWVPLVDINRDMYPLEVIPGSHKNGFLPSSQSSHETWEVKPECYDEKDFVPVEVEIGDVVFMSNFTIHRSSSKGDPSKVRLACSTRFDNADEATFVERCYPTAYIRSVHREQYYDNFPSHRLISEIFS